MGEAIVETLGLSRALVLIGRGHLGEAWGCISQGPIGRAVVGLARDDELQADLPVLTWLEAAGLVEQVATRGGRRLGHVLTPKGQAMTAAFCICRPVRNPASWCGGWRCVDGDDCRCSYVGHRDTRGPLGCGAVWEENIARST